MDVDDERGEQGEDAEEQPRRRIPLVAKIAVIAGLWVLLVVFLVGLFNGDSDDDDAAIVLDQGSDSSEVLLEAAGEDGEADEDTDGDGDVDAADVELAGVPAPTGGSLVGSGGDGSTTTARPVGGPGTTISPDERPAPGSSTTTLRGGGGGQSTTSTTKPPGSTTSTTTSTTSTTAPQEYSATVNVDRAGSGPEFSKSSVSIKRGEALRFVNKDSNTAHTLRFSDTNEVLALAPGATIVRRFDQSGDVGVECTVPSHHGSLTVKVGA